MSKIVKVEFDGITFDDGHVLYSEHEQECCESHWLNFEDVQLDEVKDLEFDLAADGAFFERVEDYGIRLKPTNGHPVSIPGYAVNNGYYSADLTLVLERPNGERVRWDVRECQADRD